MEEPISKIVKAIRNKQYRLSKHYWENYIIDNSRPSPQAIIESIGKDDPQIIEDYPNDRRGPSCLILGISGKGIKIHSIIAYWCNPIKIITAYVPDDNKWIGGRIRIKEEDERNEKENV